MVGPKKLFFDDAIPKNPNKSIELVSVPSESITVGKNYENSNTNNNESNNLDSTRAGSNMPANIEDDDKSKEEIGKQKKLDRILKDLKPKIKIFKKEISKKKITGDDGKKIKQMKDKTNEILKEIKKNRLNIDLVSFKNKINRLRENMEEILKIFVNNAKEINIKDKENNANPAINAIRETYESLDELNIFILGSENKFKQINVQIPLKVKNKDAYKIIKAFGNVSVRLEQLRNCCGFRKYFKAGSLYKKYNSINEIFQNIKNYFIGRKGWINSDTSNKMNKSFEKVEKLIPGIVVSRVMERKNLPNKSDDKVKVALKYLYSAFSKLYFELFGIEFKVFEFYDFIPYSSNKEEEEAYYIGIIGKGLRKLKSDAKQYSEENNDSKKLFDILNPKYKRIKKDLGKKNKLLRSLSSEFKSKIKEKVNIIYKKNKEIEEESSGESKEYLNDNLHYIFEYCDIETQKIDELDKKIQDIDSNKEKNKQLKTLNRFKKTLKIFVELEDAFKLWLKRMINDYTIIDNKHLVEYQKNDIVYSAALQISEKLEVLSKLLSNLGENIYELNKLGNEFIVKVSKLKKIFDFILRKKPEIIENIFSNLYNELVKDDDFKKILYDKKFRNEFTSDIYSNLEHFECINRNIGDGQFLVSSVLNKYSNYCLKNQINKLGNSNKNKLDSIDPNEFSELDQIDNEMQKDLIKIVRKILDDYENIYKYMVDITKSHAAKILVSDLKIAKSFMDEESRAEYEKKVISDCETMFSKKKVIGDRIIGNVLYVFRMTIENSDDMSVDVVMSSENLGSSGETYDCGKGYCLEITSYDLRIKPLNLTSSIHVYIAFKSATAVNLAQHMLKRTGEKKNCKGTMNFLSNTKYASKMESLVQVKVRNNLHSGKFYFLPCKEHSESDKDKEKFPKIYPEKTDAMLAMECYQNLQKTLKDHKTDFVNKKIFGKKTVYDHLNGYIKSLSKNFESATSNPIEAAEIIKTAISDIDACTRPPSFYYVLKNHLKELSNNLQSVDYDLEKSIEMVQNYTKKINKKMLFHSEISKCINNVLKTIKSANIPEEIMKIIKDKNDDLNYKYKNSIKFSEGTNSEIMKIIRDQLKILGNSLVGEDFMKNEKLSFRKTNMLDIVGTQVFSMVVPTITNSIILVTLESRRLVPWLLEIFGFEHSIKTSSNDLGILLADCSFNLTDDGSLWGLRFLANLVSGAKEKDLKDVIRLRVYLLTSNSILKKGKIF